MGPFYGSQQRLTQTSQTGKEDISRENDIDEEDTQPHPVVSARPRESYQEPVYREHVSGTLYAHPADAPNFRPAYPAAPAFMNGGLQAPAQGSQVPSMMSNGRAGAVPNVVQPGGYLPPGYYAQSGAYLPPGHYPPPGYSWYAGYVPNVPPKPKRDGYLFGVSIASFTCTILVVLGGIGCLLFLIVFLVISSRTPLKPAQKFGGIVEFITLSIAGLLGGGFGLYHSIRVLFLQKPSGDFKLPWFWLFLLLYAVVIGIAEAVRSTAVVTNVPIATIFILLCGVLPALAVMALTVRRIHFPREIRWPTSWRRVTFSLIGGATLAVVLAGVFELLLSALTAQALHITNIQLDNPDAPLPSSPREIGFLILLVSVIAPIVEETVKPLAVVVLIGRVRSAAEAFVLGMAGGIGFDLVETAGYMGQGYKNWVDVAIERTSAGLLHGLGAAMVALGWYYITHRSEMKKRKRVLIALGCWSYAILQHAIWNGSSFLQVLPGPVGQYLSSGSIGFGSLSLPAFLLVYMLETVLILMVMLVVTGRLRPKLAKGMGKAAMSRG
jgi:RsiW-degrading membrane proteinase PrsW (M82 family)